MMPRVVAAIAALLLGACASAPTVMAPMDQAQAERRWQDHRSALARIRAFELRGRLGGSALGVKADVLWQQTADGRFTVRVSGPFGSGATTLRGDDTLVEVTSADGSVTTADPEQWLHQRYGWTLPVSGLRWWALGLPAPRSAAKLQLNAGGRVETLEQDGWRLHFTDYAATGGWTLPKRLEATRGDLTLRFLADQWTGLDGG